MTTLVTGGTGFIGARIVRNLVERGEEVVCFDMAPPRANLQPYLDRIRVYRGDITQIPQLLEAVNSYEVERIIHMAAVLPPSSEDRPHFAMLVNIQGANNVFEVARWGGVRRVVYASSISVYAGQEAYGEGPVNEEALPSPGTVYGMTKMVNDFSAARYTALHGLDLRGVQICTVFGHGRVTGDTGMIGGLLMSGPAVGKPIDLPFDKDMESPMIYADDAAEIFVRLALADTLRHPTYISGGHRATIGDLIDIVLGFIPDAKITTGERRMSHLHSVDNSRMLADLGYELPPLRARVLDHINEARAEAGLPPVAG